MTRKPSAAAVRDQRRRNYQDLAATLNILANPHRLAILHYLNARPEPASTIGDLIVGLTLDGMALTSSSVSQHVTRLASVGLVAKTAVAHPGGRHVEILPVPAALSAVAEALAKLAP